MKKVLVGHGLFIKIFFRIQFLMHINDKNLNEKLLYADTFYEKLKANDHIVLSQSIVRVFSGSD